MKSVNVDHIWRTLGPLGKYQLKQMSSYLLSLISWSFQGLNIVFIGHRPGFQCKPSPNDTLPTNFTNVEREYRECEIVTYENSTDGIIETSSSCVHGWEYDAPVDQSFVTEGCVFNELCERGLFTIMFMGRASAGHTGGYINWNFVCENEELAELSQVLYLVGMMIGTFVFPTLSDRLGRKPVMVISHVLFFGISLGVSFSGNYTVFVILRLLTGFFNQGLLAGTTLSLETLPTEIRHYCEVAALLAWTTFGCLMSPIAFALRHYPWKYLQITYAMCSAWSVLQWWMTDESLRWVLANGQIDRARQIIKNACKWNNKNYTDILEKIGLDGVHDNRSSEMRKYSEAKDKENVLNGRGDLDPLDHRNSDSAHTKDNGNFDEQYEDDLVVERYTLFDIFRHKQILKVSMIMWYTWVCDSLVYFGLYMISSDLYGDRYINFFLSALIEYPAVLIEYLCLARIGRKWTVVIGHFIAAVGLAVATALTYTAKGNSGMLAASTAFTLIGKMGVTTGYSSVYLTTPELYPTNMRNMGLGVCSFMEKVGSMIAPFSRNVSSKIKWLPACVYAILCLFVVVLFAFVPETNGVELPTTIEELKEWYRGNKFELKFGKNRRASIQQSASRETKEKKLKNVAK